MGRGTHRTHDIELARMAMAGREIRNIVASLNGALDDYLHGVSRELAGVYGTRHVVACADDIRSAGEDVLARIDEILEALDGASPVARHLMEAMRLVDRGMPGGISACAEHG